MDLILTNQVMWISCGFLCFYQLFGLSFWQHPFTTEDPLVSKWCNATFPQICSDKQTNSSTSWMAWGWVHFHFCVNYSFKGPLWLLTAKDPVVTSDHVNVPLVEYAHASTIDMLFMHWNLHSGHYTWIFSQQVIHFHICSVLMPPDIYPEYMDPHNSFLWIKSEQTDWLRIHHRHLESPLDILLVVVALFPDQFCRQSSSAVRIRISLLVSRRSVCKS